MRCAISQLNSVNSEIIARIESTFPFKFKAGKEIAEEEKEKFWEIISQANAVLEKTATLEEIAECFSLLSGGMKMPKELDAVNTAKAFMIALEGKTSWAIRQAVFDYLRGNVEGNKVFMPASPELANYCDKLERDAVAQIGFISRVLNISNPNQK